MKKSVVILAIAVLATGAVATSLWLDLHAEHRKADEIATRLAAAESKQLASAAAPQLQAPVMPAVPVPVPPPVAAPAAVTAASASPRPAAGAANPPTNGTLEAMGAPAGQGTVSAMMRAMMAQMYPDIEQELGLTPQQQQQLFDLLADEGQDQTQMVLGSGQDPAARREMQRKLVEAERSQDAKVSALLGSKYPKWEEYQSTAQARQQVDQLRRTLSVSENPLSEAQSKQLVTAFSVELKRSSKEQRDWARSPAAVNSPDMMRETVQQTIASQQRLLDVASPILSIAQMDRYKQQMEQQTTVLRATMGMMGGGSMP